MQCNGSACDGVTPDHNKAATVEREGALQCGEREMSSAVMWCAGQCAGDTAAAGAQAHHSLSNKEAGL